jgi:ubiquinone/menaquinone biosynthesis C-methylase UbiE
MIYQHPLAYLLGVEGGALLRGWAGDYDKEFVEARLAEVKRLLANDSLVNHPGVMVGRGDTQAAYRQWSSTYDDGRNSLYDYDEPVVYEILDALPKGTILDAACGTGRYAEHAIAYGHRVIGVDSSPDMLGRARARVAEAEFRLGDLHELPLADNAVDIVVCGLALTHVAQLGPVIAEFARVLRPGGHVVIADVHHDLVLAGSVPVARGPGDEPGLSATYRHTTGAYIRAALPVGLQVRRCEETLVMPSRPPVPATPDAAVGDWADWPWSLMEMLPAATLAAFAGPEGWPQIIVWHFQLAES